MERIEHARLDIEPILGMDIEKDAVRLFLRQMPHEDGGARLGSRQARARPDLGQHEIRAVNPQAYLAGVLSRLVNGWPMRQIDQLMPWVHATPNPRRAVA